MDFSEIDDLFNEQGELIVDIFSSQKKQSQNSQIHPEIVEEKTITPRIISDSSVDNNLLQSINENLTLLVDKYSKLHSEVDTIKQYLKLKKDKKEIYPKDRCKAHNRYGKPCQGSRYKHSQNLCFAHYTIAKNDYEKKSGKSSLKSHLYQKK